MFAFLKPRRIALLALLAASATLIASWFARPDPVLAEARQLQQRLLSDETRRLPIAQQLELHSQLQSEVQKLSPAQRRVLAADGRRLLIEKIEHYRALPKTEQLTFLDAEINRLVLLRREETNAAGQQTASGRTRKSARGQTTTGGNTGGPTLPVSGNERESYLKAQLDKTTPEERALVADFIKQLVDRWKALGLLASDVPDDPQAILALFQ